MPDTISSGGVFCLFIFLDLMWFDSSGPVPVQKSSSLAAMPSLSEYLQNFSAVVVTGGSSGIGKSFISHIRTLHPEIFICNLSRRCPDNAAELKVRHFPCDLSRAGELEKTARELETCLRENASCGRILLINNSGFGSYGEFPIPDLVHHL